MKDSILLLLQREIEPEQHLVELKLSCREREDTMSETTDIALEISHSSEQKDTPSTELLVECEPTAEELSTLEHVSDHIPSAVWLIVICEFCERFAFFGLSGPFQNYIQYPVPGPNTTQPGALDRGQLTATSLTTFFRFLCYLTPIIGAILADQFWGKYKTILLSCIVYAIGLLVLVFSSLPSAIRAGIAFPGLILAMIIIGFGTGGVKSNVSPLMAEQYTRTKPIVRRKGITCSSERSIVLVYCRSQRTTSDHRSKNVSLLARPSVLR
jgi:hypothetical protein